MAGETHILVGCGGSGIRTLRRLNELFSEDSSWRRWAPTDVYYIVVDTDTAEIQEFEEAVRNDFAGMPETPYVLSVPLARGESHLQPLVEQAMVFPFERGQNREGQQRLLEHWWNRGPDQPFFAPMVRPLVRGAGQCPPVSYFLTWRKLRTIEDDFRRLVREIMRRKGGLGRFNDVNFLIVAGLAGGTGRGSWELIAFKLRQLFSQQYDRAPTPRAFLFDATLFQDIYEQAPAQKTPMMVNSLTGLSQLACWTLNRQRGHQHRESAFVYRLPNLETPQDPETDVLNVTLELDVSNAAPVDHAYLIFRENQLVQLANHYQYYEMAAAAIYAALSKSSITRQEINHRSSYVGLASATFEVSAVSLRKYFESLARVRATQMLTEVNSSQVDQAVSKFWDRTGLLVDVTADDPFSRFTPDQRGTLLQRVLARIEQKSKPKLANVERALREQNVEDARRFIQGAMLQDDTLVEQSFRDVVSEEGIDPVEVAKQGAQDLLDRSKSIANVQSYLEKLMVGLNDEIVEMPAEMSIGRDDPRQLLEEYANREFPTFWVIFSQEEQRKLLEVTRSATLRAQYQAIRQQLRRYYDRWIEQLGVLRDNAQDLLECVMALQRRFQRACQHSVGEVTATESVFDRLFTPPDQPEKGLDRRFSERRFYRRELKPLLAKGEDVALLRDVVDIHREVIEVARQALAQPTPADRHEARQQLERQLETAIRDTVGISSDFIVEHFSLPKVAQQTQKAWRARLQQHMSEDERHHLESRYEEMFGFRPRRRSDTNRIEYDFPESVDDMLCHMAASLARTCKPFWVLRRRRDDLFNVILFIPSTQEQAYLEGRVREYLGEDTAQVEVEVYPEIPSDTGQRTTGNPFLMLAYSTQGVESLDDIASLNYYNEPEVLPLLRKAESKDGETIFHGSRNGGLGYTDPLYVTDARVSSLRWRPWLVEDTVTQQREREVVDALLYALFPGDGPSTDYLRQVVNDLQSIGWSLPLIAHRGRNRFNFSRLPLLLANNQVQIDQQIGPIPGWDVDRPVAVQAGLHNCYQVLMGRDSDRGDRGTAWCQRILREADDFWNRVLLQINIARGTPNYIRLLEDYRSWLGTKCREVDEDDPSRQVWAKLVDRVSEMIRDASRR